MTTPELKSPCSGGHEICNVGIPSRAYNYYMRSLSDLCSGVEMKIFEKNMHFHYMTCMVTP